MSEPWMKRSLSAAEYDDQYDNNAQFSLEIPEDLHEEDISYQQE